MKNVASVFLIPISDFFTSRRLLTFPHSWRFKRALAHRACVAAVLLASTAAQAQLVPDAGSILREQPKPPAVPARPPVLPPIEKPAEKPEAAGPRILVKEIRIKGNTLISEAELLAGVRGALVGKEASFQQLQNAALSVTGIYAQRGYLARVFLPPQDLKDGVVLFEVVEGARGALRIENRGQRIDADRVHRFVEERLPAGGPMDFETLAQTLALLNEQPGIATSSSLAQGKGEREVDVTVTASEPPLATFSAGLNNQGSRGTGVPQASAGVGLVNPTGRFDAASLLVNASEGSTYGRADYSLMLGDRGLRLGVNASALKYELVQDAFKALQANGTADTFGLTASYPLERQLKFGLTLTASADEKKLVDRALGVETGNRLVRVATLGANGYAVIPPEIIGGLATYGISITSGDTEQRNAAALAADQASRRTEGGFAKLAWNLGLLRPLDRNWNLTATARGQEPSKNLESSERFALGGVTGIRAYPVGEAAGDGGWLASVAVTRPVGAVRLGGFLDAGGITLNHTVPPQGTLRPNRYTLAGAGVSLDWQPFSGANLSFVLAAPIGNNPGQDANGNNADGSKASRPRAWLSFIAYF